MNKIELENLRKLIGYDDPAKNKRAAEQLITRLYAVIEEAIGDRLQDGSAEFEMDIKCKKVTIKFKYTAALKCTK